MENTLRNHGQGLVEYALLLALIAIIAIASLSFLGGSIKGVLLSVNIGGPAATAAPTAAPTPTPPAHYEGDPCGNNDHWHFQNGQWVCR